MSAQLRAHVAHVPLANSTRFSSSSARGRAGSAFHEGRRRFPERISSENVPRERSYCRKFPARPEAVRSWGNGGREMGALWALTVCRASHESEVPALTFAEQTDVNSHAAAPETEPEQGEFWNLNTEWVHRALMALVLVASAALPFLAQWGTVLSSGGLVDDTEPLFAEASRQMLITGDYITPQFNAHPRFDKPPLTYWLMALCLKAASVLGLAPPPSSIQNAASVAALRCPSVLSVVAISVMLAATVLRFGLWIPLQSESAPTHHQAHADGLPHTSDGPALQQPATSQGQTQAQPAQAQGASSAFRAHPSFTPGPSDELQHGSTAPSEGGLGPLNLARDAGEGSTSEGRRARLVQALAAASALALCPGMLVWGSVAVSDAVLLACTSASILAFFWAYALRSSRFYLASAAAAGLAVLAKGPIGLLVPGAICCAFLALSGDFWEVASPAGGELPWAQCACVFGAIALPWFLLMGLRHGPTYFSTFFGYHNLERYTLGVNHHTGRPWFYPLLMAVALHFPWSFHIPTALWRALKRERGRGHFREARREQRLVLLAVLWLAIPFCAFGLSRTQLPSYYLPMAPAIALLSAAVLHKAQRSSIPEDKQSPSLFGVSGVQRLAVSLGYTALAVALLVAPTALLRGASDPKARAIALGLIAELIHFRGALVLLAAAALIGNVTFVKGVKWALSKFNSVQEEELSAGGTEPAPASRGSEGSETSVAELSEAEGQSSSDSGRGGGEGVGDSAELKGKPGPGRRGRALGKATSALVQRATRLVPAKARQLRARLVPLWLTHAASMLFLLGAFLQPALRVADRVLQQPLRDLSSVVVSTGRKDEPVTMVGARMPSIVFYMNRPVAFIPSAEDAVEPIRTFLQSQPPRAGSESKGSIDGAKEGEASSQGGKEEPSVIALLDEDEARSDAWVNGFHISRLGVTAWHSLDRVTLLPSQSAGPGSAPEPAKPEISVEAHVGGEVQAAANDVERGSDDVAGGGRHRAPSSALSGDVGQGGAMQEKSGGNAREGE